MKKLTLILFLFNILLGYSQNNPGKTQQKVQKLSKTSSVNSEQNPNVGTNIRTGGNDNQDEQNGTPIPTQAQDWNSSRSNKTSKTQSIANPGGNDDDNINNQNTSRAGNPNQGKDTKKSITASLSSGISTPSSNFSNDAYVKNGNYFELTGAYYFSKFGIGISVGQIASPTNENFSNSINSTDIPTTNSTQNWKQFYYGIGPEYKAQFGNFNATFSTKIGLQSVKSINLESNYTNGETPIAILKIKSDKTSSLSYFSTDLRFGYNLSSNFSLYATVNYMSALSNGITISKSKITDSNQNGIIDAEDLKFATGSATIDYETSTQNIKPQSTNFGIGISYIFRSKKGYDYYKANADNVKRKRPGRTTYNNITLERNQAKDDGDENNGTKAINHDASRSNNTNSIVDSKGDGDDSTARRGKRKAKKECLKNGGSFWENGNGSYHCMMPLSTAKVGENTNNELFRSKKRKCFKAGGKWVTNSYGSFCWNPSATSKVYGPGDAHFGSTTFKSKKPSRTGRNPQTGATIQIAAKKVVKFKAGTASQNTVNRIHKPSDAHHENTTKTARLKMLADELVNSAVKKNPHPHDNNEKTANLKKLADELVNLAVKENPNHHGDNLKYADLKKLADELVNLAVKENPNHHRDNLKYVDLKKLADELVNLATKNKDSVGNINWNVKENLSVKKPSRTGRNPQTGATIKGIAINDPKGDNENNGTKAINHDASRSNNTNSIVDSKGDGDDSTARRGKRKAKKECLKNGGSFWESGDGSYHCMMPLSTAKAGENTNNELFRSKKRKCFKAGGQWVTNSYGSFCWNPKKQTARVEVRGWNPKEKSTSRKGYDYYKANADNVKQKRPGRTTYSNITLERSQAKGDGDDSTARRGKRKAKKECLKNGGSFWENGNGPYHCMMPLSTAKAGEITNNELFRSKKRKCFKAGGQWVTNSHGSFCWNPKK